MSPPSVYLDYDPSIQQGFPSNASLHIHTDSSLQISRVEVHTVGTSSTRCTTKRCAALISKVTVILLDLINSAVSPMMPVSQSTFDLAQFKPVHHKEEHVLVDKSSVLLDSTGVGNLDVKPGGTVELPFVIDIERELSEEATITDKTLITDGLPSSFDMKGSCFQRKEAQIHYEAKVFVHFANKNMPFTKSFPLTFSGATPHLTQSGRKLKLTSNMVLYNAALNKRRSGLFVGITRRNSHVYLNFKLLVLFPSVVSLYQPVKPRAFLLSLESPEALFGVHHGFLHDKQGEEATIVNVSESPSDHEMNTPSQSTQTALEIKYISLKMVSSTAIKKNIHKATLIEPPVSKSLKFSSSTLIDLTNLVRTESLGLFSPAQTDYQYGIDISHCFPQLDIDASRLTPSFATPNIHHYHEVSVDVGFGRLGGFRALCSARTGPDQITIIR